MNSNPGHHGHVPRTYLDLLFSQSDCIAVPIKHLPLSQYETFSELFCVNPLDGVTDHEPTKSYHAADRPRRADMNVCKFPNFIFESDSAPLETQIAALKNPAIANITRLAVFSANKSVSLIVSVADSLPFVPHTEAGVHDYKLAWNGLRAHIEALTGITMDPSTKNPSRLTRTPAVQRLDTGKMQDVLHTGPLVTADFILSHMRTALTTKKQHYAPTNIESSVAFEKFMSNEYVVRGLRNRLQNSHEWAKPVNMYPEILRLTLWAIDATQAPLEAVRAYYWKYTFPALLAAGYDRSKIEDGLINAYKYKGLL